MRTAASVCRPRYKYWSSWTKKPNANNAVAIPLNMWRSWKGEINTSSKSLSEQLRCPAVRHVRPSWAGNRPSTIRLSPLTAGCCARFVMRGHYIQELPRAVQDRPEWQTAVYASAPDRSAAHHAALAARKAPPEGMEGRGKSWHWAMTERGDDHGCREHVLAFKGPTAQSTSRPRRLGGPEVRARATSASVRGKAKRKPRPTRSSDGVAFRFGQKAALLRTARDHGAPATLGAAYVSAAPAGVSQRRIRATQQGPRTAPTSRTPRRPMRTKWGRTGHHA